MLNCLLSFNFLNFNAHLDYLDLQAGDILDAYQMYGILNDIECLTSHLTHNSQHFIYLEQRLNLSFYCRKNICQQSRRAQQGVCWMSEVAKISGCFMLNEIPTCMELDSPNN